MTDILCQGSFSPFMPEWEDLVKQMAIISKLHLDALFSILQEWRSGLLPYCMPPNAQL